VVRFQGLAYLRDRCVSSRVIDSGTTREFWFQINLRLITFFDGLLRRILSERSSNGIRQETGELTSLDKSLNTSRFRCLET
jgi:hypothetical protein